MAAKKAGKSNVGSAGTKAFGVVQDEPGIAQGTVGLSIPRVLADGYGVEQVAGTGAKGTVPAVPAMKSVGAVVVGHGITHVVGIGANDEIGNAPAAPGMTTPFTTGMPSVLAPGAMVAGHIIGVGTQAACHGASVWKASIES